MNLHKYSFERVSDEKCIPIGPLPSDDLALALLEREVGGGRLTLEDKGEIIFLMKRSLDGWGYPNIPVYRA
jgi:hypothetical protein